VCSVAVGGDACAAVLLAATARALRTALTQQRQDSDGDGAVGTSAAPAPLSHYHLGGEAMDALLQRVLRVEDAHSEDAALQVCSVL
jgi:hypothetical protein